MDASGKWVCAFFGERGHPEGNGCFAVENLLLRLGDVTWQGLGDDPRLTLKGLAKLCRTGLVRAVVVAVSASPDSEPPDVALERVWSQFLAPPQIPPGLVVVLFGGEETEQDVAERLMDSSRWRERDLGIVRFSSPLFLEEIQWAIERAIRSAKDALRVAERRVPSSVHVRSCIGWRPTK